MNESKHDKGKRLNRKVQSAKMQSKPHSKELEQLRHIIDTRLINEPNKKLIRYLLDKEKLNEKQFAEKLLYKMLLIKKHLLKNQTKDKKRNEEIILELLYDDLLTEGQSNDELLDDRQLVADLLNDKQLVEKIFEERFAFIPRNPKLEATVNYNLVVKNRSSIIEPLEMILDPVDIRLTHIEEALELNDYKTAWLMILELMFVLRRSERYNTIMPMLEDLERDVLISMDAKLLESRIRKIRHILSQSQP